MINSSGEGRKRKAIERKIISREGLNYYKLNILPINPKNIIIFLYIRDSLTETEKQVLYEKFFGKYIYDRTSVCRKLNISLKELINIENKLNELIAEIIKSEQYKIFRSALISKYHTKIYSIDLMNDKFDNTYKKEETLILTAV